MDQHPNIFINPEAGITTGTKRSFNLKYLFILLGVVVIVEIVIGARTLLQRSSNTAVPVNQTSSVNQTATLDSSSVINAMLTLETTKTEFKVGEEVPVSIKIDTGGQVADGVDLVLKYDPKLLQADNSSIVKGTLFPDYPVTKIEPEGTVQITAITSLVGKGYSGIGNFATINFKALSKGKAQVKVEFTKGATTDSNIVGAEVPDDMLSEVKDLEVIIR